MPSGHFSEFFNWNKVKIRYCDGASFSGHPQSEPKVGIGKLFGCSDCGDNNWSSGVWSCTCG